MDTTGPALARKAGGDGSSTAITTGYCYLPLYIFCGEQILCARLREANHDASFGSLAEIQRIVTQIFGRSLAGSEKSLCAQTPGSAETR